MFKMFEKTGLQFYEKLESINCFFPHKERNHSATSFDMGIFKQGVVEVLANIDACGGGGSDESGMDYFYLNRFAHTPESKFPNFPKEIFGKLENYSMKHGPPYFIRFLHFEASQKTVVFADEVHRLIPILLRIQGREEEAERLDSNSADNKYYKTMSFEQLSRILKEYDIDQKNIVLVRDYHQLITTYFPEFDSPFTTRAPDAKIVMAPIQAVFEIFRMLVGWTEDTYKKDCRCRKEFEKFVIDLMEDYVAMNQTTFISQSLIDYQIDTLLSLLCSTCQELAPKNPIKPLESLQAKDEVALEVMTELLKEHGVRIVSPEPGSGKLPVWQARITVIETLLSSSFISGRMELVKKLRQAMFFWIPEQSRKGKEIYCFVNREEVPSLKALKAQSRVEMLKQRRDAKKGRVSNGSKLVPPTEHGKGPSQNQCLKISESVLRNAKDEGEEKPIKLPKLGQNKVENDEKPAQKQNVSGENMLEKAPHPSKASSAEKLTETTEKLEETRTEITPRPDKENEKPPVFGPAPKPKKYIPKRKRPDPPYKGQRTLPNPNRASKIDAFPKMMPKTPPEISEREMSEDSDTESVGESEPVPVEKCQFCTSAEEELKLVKAKMGVMEKLHQDEITKIKKDYEEKLKVKAEEIEQLKRQKTEDDALEQELQQKLIGAQTSSVDLEQSLEKANHKISELEEKLEAHPAQNSAIETLVEKEKNALLVQKTVDLELQVEKLKRELEMVNLEEVEVETTSKKATVNAPSTSSSHEFLEMKKKCEILEIEKQLNAEEIRKLVDQNSALRAERAAGPDL